VRATVMNAAGTLNSGLFIRQQVLDMVYTSPHIWKIRETAELVGHMTQADEGAGTEEQTQADEGAGVEELTQADEGAGMEEPMQPGEQIEAEDSAQPDEDNGSLSGDIPQADEFRILGINDLGSVYEDCEQDLTWADGWSWESFQKSRDVCVAGTAFLVGHMAMDRAVKATEETTEFDTSFSNAVIAQADMEEVDLSAAEHKPGVRTAAISGIGMLLAAVLIGSGVMGQALRKEPLEILGELEE